MNCHNKLLICKQSIDIHRAYVNDFSLKKDKLYLLIGVSNITFASEPAIVLSFGGASYYFIEYKLIDIELVKEFSIKLYSRSSDETPIINVYNSFFEEILDEQKLQTFS